MLRSELKLDNLVGNGGGGVHLFFALLGDKMMACHTERLWLRFDDLATDEKKKWSQPIFLVRFLYAFMSLGFNGSLI